MVNNLSSEELSRRRKETLARMEKINSENTPDTIHESLIPAENVKALSGIRSSSWGGYCFTPAGRFDSVKDASLFYGIALQTIIYRCQADNFPDWSYVKPDIMACVTPLGEFKTITEAAKKHGLSLGGLIHRLNSVTPDCAGYKYLK